MENRLTLKDIADTVCAATGLDIRIKRKQNQDYFARMIYFKIARTNTFESLHRIGAEVNRDHATVMHGLKKFDVDIKLGQNSKLYNYVLRELDLDVKETISIKEEVETTNLELLQLSVLRALKELSYTQLSEFNETRLKPFKKALESRIQPKVIVKVAGAMLNKY